MHVERYVHLSTVLTPPTNQKKSLNPLSPSSDQDQFSPNNIHTLSRYKLWELIKWSLKRNCLDLLSSSLNSILNSLCMEISLEDLYVDTGA